MLVYYMFLQHTAVARLKPIFWLETLALWAFGVSWFIKGQTLWKDIEAWNDGRAGTATGA